MVHVMPTSVNGFKNFASWPVAGQRSIGLVMIQRVNQADQTVILFPKGTRFGIASLGLVFTNLEDAEINESQTMIELLVQCQAEGIAGNIAAQQQWQLPVRPDNSRATGLTLSNPNAFTQGLDAQRGGMTAQLMANEVSNEKIQNFLDVSASQIRTFLGLKESEDLPVALRIDQGVYTWCLYLIETNSSQRINKTMDFDGEITERRRHFPRDENLRHSVEMKILGLISPYRKTERFMENEDTTT